eukprot:6481790-Amphidinium_carterae.1
MLLPSCSPGSPVRSSTSVAKLGLNLASKAPTSSTLRSQPDGIMKLCYFKLIHDVSSVYSSKPASALTRTTTCRSWRPNASLYIVWASLNE